MAITTIEPAYKILINKQSKNGPDNGHPTPQTHGILEDVKSLSGRYVPVTLLLDFCRQPRLQPAAHQNAELHQCACLLRHSPCSSGFTESVRPHLDDRAAANQTRVDLVRAQVRVPVLEREHVPVAKDLAPQEGRQRAQQQYFTTTPARMTRTPTTTVWNG